MVNNKEKSLDDVGYIPKKESKIGEKYLKKSGENGEDIEIKPNNLNKKVSETPHVRWLEWLEWLDYSVNLHIKSEFSIKNTEYSNIANIPNYSNIPTLPNYSNIPNYSNYSNMLLLLFSPYI